MKRYLFLFIFLFAPVLCFAYTSAVYTPHVDTDLRTIEDPFVAQDFFGTLQGFPHTYTFSVSRESNFAAHIFVFDGHDQQNDVSIILVKRKARGVDEIGRTHADQTSWITTRDAVLAERFRDGGTIQTTLTPGTYLLEVNTPDNTGLYRLHLNGPGSDLSYFGQLREIAAVKHMRNEPFIYVFASPYYYLPLLLILLIACAWWYYRKYHA